VSKLPEHIILQLLKEAWSNKQVKIISIYARSLSSLDYWEINYGVLNSNNDWVYQTVSYSYSLHIRPRMEKWREERLSDLVD